MKRKTSHQSTHPFDPYPFEAYSGGSWQTVERLRIRNGSIYMQLIDNEDQVTEESNISISNLRLRSRKATLSDCKWFLRPGLDICVLLTPHTQEVSEDDDDEDVEPVHAQNPPDENIDPVWIEAKISSIERKLHENKCECQFYVNIFSEQGPAGMKKKAYSKETTLVQLDQISILQRLEKNPCESKHYRWSFSEDCITRNMPKLFTGQFSSDITWLLVASVLKQLIFDVRSIQNQIVYLIWDGEEPPESHSTAINFRLDNEILVPFLVPLISVCTAEKELDSDMKDVGHISFYDQMDSRRSKRRYVQPDRYVGDSNLLESDVDFGASQVETYKTYKEKYQECGEYPPASSIQNDHVVMAEKCDEGGKRVNFRRREAKDVCNRFLLQQRNIKHKEVKSVLGENKSQLTNVPLPDETGMLIHKEGPINVVVPENKYNNDFTRAHRVNGFPRSHKKKISEENIFEMKGGWEWLCCQKKTARKREYRTYLNSKREYCTYLNSNRETTYYERSTIKKSYSPSVYREMIRRCLENIDDVVQKEDPPVIDQWNTFRASNLFDKMDDGEMSKNENDEESSDSGILWREMEFSMQLMNVLEDSEVPSEVQKPDKECRQVCRHDYRLNEEIGIFCRICGVVSTEIKYVMPPFLPSTSLIKNLELHSEDNLEDKTEEDGGFDIFSIPSSSNVTLSEGKDNVWALIPDLKEKLRLHQKNAFEFLWRNIAGCLEPALMESSRKQRGGCVISHSPGAGKTLLVISFLSSYLKLFPSSRPLVLAPKSTLYTWYKEIIKWDIPIPVYQIHGLQTYRGEVSRKKVKFAPGVLRDQNIMHVLDCLGKVQKWLSHPSVLLMGYTSFVTLTREDSKHAHRQYMCKVLRKCPGVLILDEGHNPRSTKSRLRKGLMKVDTNLRILLSGTLFQNNFGEYFNTLCLARPNFVSEVLRTLDPKFKRRKNGGKKCFSLENRARKLFTDKVGDRIDSKKPAERIEALNMLKNLTGGFIDVYEGGSGTLPGLQCYTCMMKSTPLQQEILSKLQNIRPQYKGFPLELELLITLGAIHPFLIKTISCANRYFDVNELDKLGRTKSELKLGSKVRFVMSLLPKCLLRQEKLLIFCHNIGPINLFIDILERVYTWRKGKEVLVLQGDVELFERGRIMDKFEDPHGASKVMLASINACAEGISLTAASRVILLDSEWNPSKSKQAIARAFRPGQDKVVYVYQLLAHGTLEEEKYRRTTWKEWVSDLIFSEDHVEDPSNWEAPNIEDELLREILEEDRAALFHSIMKNEKASNGLVRGKEIAFLSS